MAAVQLNFTLRTSSNCKTVHLLGSWDGYKNQLPLSKDPASAKPGGWKGTFRFQGSTLKQGGRYWYYYIIDGYHVSHDPARESITEPTTGRKLNVLDIPKSPSSLRPAAQPQLQLKPSSHHSTHSTHSRRISTSTVPKGRALSPSQIKCPRPTKPHETRNIATEQYDRRAIDNLALRMRSQHLSSSSSSSSDSSDSDSSSDDDSDSDFSSSVPSLSSRSSNSSSPSSVSSASSAGCCTCERYGITRSGNRVKLDCGGSRCGYSDVGSECSSESEGEYRRRLAAVSGKSTRRQGMVVRR